MMSLLLLLLLRLLLLLLLLLWLLLWWHLIHQTGAGHNPHSTRPARWNTL